MKSNCTQVAAENYFKQKGFSTIFQLTTQGLWDTNGQCIYGYDQVQILECIEVPAKSGKHPDLRFFGLLVANKIKGLFIEIIIIIN